MEILKRILSGMCAINTLSNVQMCVCGGGLLALHVIAIHTYIFNEINMANFSLCQLTQILYCLTFPWATPIFFYDRLPWKTQLLTLLQISVLLIQYFTDDSFKIK